MSDIVERLGSLIHTKRYGHWPSNVANAAAQEITRLREEGKDKDIVIDSLRTLVSELQGKLAGDTCNMCNYLERADCHEQKAGLREEVERLNTMSSRVVHMCRKRGWSMHWTHRGAYLHLESSELIEAIRGKHGDPLSEAGDALLVLMSITEYAGFPFTTVVDAANKKLEWLEESPPYDGEEREALQEPK